MSESELGINRSMASIYVPLFQHLLGPGDQLLNAGRGFAELEKEKKSGKSDAILGITQDDIIITFEDGRHRIIPIESITSVSLFRVRTIVPLVKGIRFFSEKTPIPILEFRGGKTFAMEAEKLVESIIFRNVKNMPEKTSADSKEPRIDLNDPPALGPFEATDWITSGVSEDLISPLLMTEHLAAFKNSGNREELGEKNFFDYMPLMTTELEECNHLGKLFAGYMQGAELSSNVNSRPGLYKEMFDAWNPYTTESIAENCVSTNESHVQILKHGYELAHDLLAASFRAGRYLSQDGLNEKAEEVLALGNKLAMGSLSYMFRALNKKADD
jgi:hypothetical protein